MSIKFEKPKWATGITVTAPPSGKQLIGWIKEKPPFGYFNWLARTTYDWINNLGDASAGYDSLAEFVAEAEVGDTGIIKHGLGYVPWAQLAAQGTGADVIGLDGDGEFILTTSLVHPSPWGLYDPDDFSAAVRTFSPSSAPSVGNGKAVTNGQFVVGIWDDKVQCYNRDTGATVWTHTDPGGVGDIFRDICIVNDRVYVVGGATLGVKFKSLSLVDGTQINLYGGTWVGSINQVQCDGRFVYAAGPADGGGHHIIALSLDLSTKVWGYTAGGTVTRLVTDGRELVAYDGTNIIRIDAMTGTGLETQAQVGVVALEIDSEWIYVGGAVNITRRPRNDLSISLAMSPDTTDRRAIYSDDERVFVGQEDDTVATLRVYGRYNRDRIWRRLDPSGDINCPRRQAAICMGAP